MAEKFIVNVSALIVNPNGEMLYIKRGSSEKEAPGMFVYPGGKAEYTNDNYYPGSESVIDFLEINLKREIKEETNLDIDNMEYIHSHCFKNSVGEKVILILFVSHVDKTVKIKVDGTDTVDYGWIAEAQLDKLDTYPIVKYAYKIGFEHLNKNKYHEHIEVGGIVVNSKNQFLMLKDADSGQYVFPSGPVENLPGRTWEVLERNLIRNIFSQTSIEIADGIIPFTDREFLTSNGFEKIMQFFICKYSGGEPTVTNPIKYSAVGWFDINSMKESDFRPIVYTVFKKALEFINQINS